MPANEHLYQQRLNQDRARYEQAQTEDRARQAPPEEKPPFPWIMFCVAIIFDLIGLIPIVNIATEALAGLIFGLWQKKYLPKSNPVITFIIAKVADAVILGFLPSNIGIALYAYFKKKAASKIKFPIGGTMAKAAIK